MEEFYSLISKGCRDKTCANSTCGVLILLHPSASPSTYNNNMSSRKTRSSESSKSETGPGSRASDPVPAASSAFRYHPFLRLFLEAKHVYFTEKGATLRKAKEITCSHVRDWAEREGWSHIYSTGARTSVPDDETASRTAAPLRRLFKQMLASVDTYNAKQNHRHKRPEPSEQEIFVYMRNVTSNLKMLSKIFKYSDYILPFSIGQTMLDTRAMDLYLAICNKHGESEVIDGEDPLKVLSLPSWNLESYFEKPYFFPIVPEKGRVQGSQRKKRFSPPPHMLMCKIAADSTIFLSRKRKRYRRASSIWACTSVSVEVIYNAWNAFAHRLTFRDADELLSPFLYYNTISERLEVAAKNLCIPCKFASRLYVHCPQGCEEDEEEYRVEPLVPTIGVQHDSDAVSPIFQKLSQACIEILRGFAKDFLKDIYNDSVASEVCKSEAAEVEKLSIMKKYSLPGPDDSSLPSRFLYEQATITAIRRQVNNVRLSLSCCAAPSSRDVSPTPPIMIPSVACGSAGSISGVHRKHVCDERCDCSKLRNDLISKIVALPLLVTCDFEDLNEVLSEDLTDLNDKVQLIVTDPPYNIRRRHNRNNSQYDKILPESMKKLIDICAELLRPGGHLFMFCAAEQFRGWMKIIEEHRSPMSGLLSFTMTKTPIVLCPKRGHYSYNPSHLSLTHKNITDMAVHAVRKVGQGDFEKARDMVSWVPHGYIDSTYPPYTNVIDGYIPLEAGESLRAYSSATSTASSASTMLRAEQKSLNLMKEIVARYSKAGDIVVDLFSGTCTTAVACISLPEYRQFYGCDSDSEALTRGRERMLDAYIYYSKNRMLPPSLQVPEELQETVNILYTRYEFDDQPPRGLPCHRPAGDDFRVVGPPLATRIPQYMLEYLNTCNGTTDFTDAGIIKSTPDKYPSHLRGLLNTTPEEHLLNISLAHQKLLLVKNPAHPDSTYTLVPMRTVEAGSVIGHVFGTLFYTDWSQGAPPSRAYTSGYCKMRLSDFRAKRVSILKSGTRLSLGGHENEENDATQTSSHVYLVPTRLCPFWFARHSTYSNPSHNAIYRIRCSASPSLSFFIDPTQYEVVAKVRIQKATPIIISQKPEYSRG